MENNSIIKSCREASRQMRIDLIEMTHEVGSTGAHIGGSLSLVEIMSVLYLATMKYDIKKLDDEDRDRLILSKGHGVMAQYVAMKQAGIISEEELLTFKKNSTRLYAHPSMNREIGIEFSSGSLGQGLSLAVGAAIALKRKKNEASRIFVVVGDGECDEGSIWEAAASASHYNLDNIVVIVDKNALQYDGCTHTVMNKDTLKERWQSFGFETVEVDGHNEQELMEAFEKRISKKPLAVIANTVKGKGVSFMENNPVWHNGALSEEQYHQALKEQEVRA